ncbi:MAG: hypothetical protein K0R63_1667 [Rickettsiales bacterium]|nr:hypothetical protein [Rickettsiales bacterium]
MVVEQYTSHMTGIISLAADNIALNQWLSAVTMLFYIVCFIVGASTTAILVMWARRHSLHSQYALPLIFEAMLLMIFGLIYNMYVSQMHLSISYVIALLCYLMGLQNAVITKLSCGTIRTTHITGMVTDIGIEIGKMLYAFGERNKRHVDFNKEKISLHLSIVIVFLLGGIFGAYGFKYLGFLSVVPLAGYLLFIALLPLRRDWIVQKYRRKRRKRNH